MDLTATLTEIKTMSIEDRKKLAEAILDSIAEDEAPDLSEAQRSDLSRRIAELDANPENVLTWEQIKAHIKRRE